MENILIEKSTIHYLKANTNLLFDTPRDQKSRQVLVDNLTYIPYVEDKKLLVTANTRTKLNKYKTSIMFDRVTYVEQDNRWKVEIKTRNDVFYIYSIKRNRWPVSVSCTCLDFYYMFSVWNQKDDSLFGDPPEPYIKKTDRPLRNPTREPGVCKHILRLSDELIGAGVLK
jgi:hypothetical protein